MMSSNFRYLGDILQFQNIEKHVITWSYHRFHTGLHHHNI